MKWKTNAENINIRMERSKIIWFHVFSASYTRALRVSRDGVFGCVRFSIIPPQPSISEARAPLTQRTDDKTFQRKKQTS